MWNRFKETGNVRRPPGAGRPRATTSSYDRYIQLTARRNRTENATQLQRQLLLATGRKVSSQTARNRLHEGGLYARRPMVCIPLTPHHRAARRRWAAEHRDWEQHDWSQVLFTDESQFSLESDTRRVLVWRDRGTRNNPAFVNRRAGWMVWGGISIGGRTDLHIIRNGTLTGRRYADEILRPYVIPYAVATGDSFVFQDDNARPHRARVVENMLEAETIQRMEWPACSPDLNPIEPVWDMLGRRIAARPRPPATVRDLEIALLEEWNSIPQSLIDNLIASMANRLSSYGLKLNISKCVFGVTELIFLGHLITPDGIKPLPDKVQAVLDYKQPETVGSLRKFLGLLNFYRRFLPKAAEQQYLLSEFLKGSKGKKDSKPLNWSSEAITAFQRCKQALADAALLAHPSPSAPLALHVDASDYAIGGALHQVVDSELQPLAFFSRKLTSSEKFYSAYDRKKHKCSPRQIRQLDFISQFTTNIVHIPGSDNIAADVLSRVSSITFPSQIDYDCIAETQQTDQELHTLIASGTSLELKKVTFPNSSTEIMCDLSTGTARPYIPKQHRQDVFSAMHNLSHPGIRRSVHLMKQHFVWPSISSDVAKWARHCLACQKSKIHRHTRSPLSSFQEPSQRFDHVHLDLIGPLPPSNGYTYCLTMIDRFSKWPKAQPLKDTTAETVAEAFFSSWVSRFGTPAILTTDRGRQFESSLFKALSNLLGVQKCRTTGYHPQANGMIEELHRPLKSAIKCHATERWTEVLPIILLGLRASL
ncbi:transposon Tf2-6 polyprotein [Trichonephila clavipes]|nr:transposon Tf2-6 polyprotein [Trichonephila clavipes]